MALTLVNCAKRGSPSGGPIDSIPPVFIKADPPNYSTNFDGDEIRIYFDEYIKLKDYQKQLIISPPLKNSIISPQGSASKYITVDIKDTLQPNTTYVFNFGQSIVDNNEENPYAYFKYILSTGSYIDSLTVQGEINDALSKTTDNFVSVMLYAVDSTYNDSIIYKDVPRYVTNTLDSLKTFELTNLKEGTYMIAAMKDEDANFTFQPSKDKIAFLETFITVPKDTSYTLNLFQERPAYKVSRPRHVGANRVNFGITGNTDSIAIDLISEVPDNFESLLTKTKEDTLSYWFKPVLEKDSLLFEITAPKLRDTLTAKLRSLPADSLYFNAITRGTLRFGQPFEIKPSIPVLSLNGDLLTVLKDSTTVTSQVRLDSLTRNIAVSFDTEEDSKYVINALPGTFTDFTGAVNDTLQFSIRTKELSDYGDIEFTIQNAKNFPYLVELLDDKEKIVAYRYTTEETQFTFNTLEPGNYLVRLIEDRNKNRIYDTGTYLKKIQPERVLYYPEVIEVRAGWLPSKTFILKD